MIIPHIWSLLGRESWSRWIPQGKTRMLFVSGSIIHSLVLDFPQQECHLGCGDRRLAVRAELDKSPCRRCVWNHFGKAAPPLCPDSCLWSSSLLQEVLQEREVCVLLPLLAPNHPALLTKPRSWKRKRAQISLTGEKPRKNPNMLWSSHGMAGQTPGLTLVCSGLWLLLRLSQPLMFPLSRSPVAVSGARIAGLRFVSGPSGVVGVPVVTPVAADLHTRV